MEKCNLCPRKCNVERTKILGACGMTEKVKIAKVMLHRWEEPCISGENGSGAVFFSGCPLKCVFCQNYDVSHRGLGKEVTVERLAEIFYKLQSEGAHNINLVSPTQFCNQIIEALKISMINIPVVWNSGGYETVEMIEKLERYVDVFLFDFKYFSPERAEKYSKAKDYPLVAKEAIKCAYNLKKTVFSEDNLMKSGVIIRHLLMPSGTKDAIEIARWIKENTPDAIFSFMSQYTVFPTVDKFPEISRKITRREYEKVTNEIYALGLRGYFQDFESATSDYTPKFDFEGV